MPKKDPKKEYPSDFCKKFGLNLDQVSEISTYPTKTLDNMFKNQNKRFQVVVIGCAAISIAGDVWENLNKLKGVDNDSNS